MLVIQVHFGEYDARFSFSVFPFSLTSTVVLKYEMGNFWRNGAKWAISRRKGAKWATLGRNGHN